MSETILNSALEHAQKGYENIPCIGEKSSLTNLTNKTGILDSIDISTEGGLVATLPADENSLFVKEPEVTTECVRNLITDDSKVKKEIKTEKDKIFEGKRNITLESIAGKLRYKDYDEDRVKQELSIINYKQCMPPLEDKEINDIVKNVFSYNSIDCKQFDYLSDTSNVNRMAELFSEDIKYCVDDNQWFVYENPKWTPNNYKIMEYVTLTANSFKKDLEKQIPEQYKTEIKRHIRNSLNFSKLKAMATLASSDKRFIISKNKFENKFYINCQNGIVDLKTGDLIDYNKNYFISNMCNVSYNPTETVNLVLKCSPNLQICLMSA